MNHNSTAFVGCDHGQVVIFYTNELLKYSSATYLQLCMYYIVAHDYDSFIHKTMPQVEQYIYLQKIAFLVLCMFWT